MVDGDTVGNLRKVGVERAWEGLWVVVVVKLGFGERESEMAAMAGGWSLW